MLELLRIAEPPSPDALVLTAGGSAGVVLGMTLALLGRSIWRLIPAALAAGCAAWGGWALAPHLPLHPGIVIAAFAVPALIIAAVLAKWLWAALMALSLSAGSLLGLMLFRPPGVDEGPTPTAPAAAIDQWAATSAGQLWQWLGWMFDKQPAVVLTSGVGAAMVGLAIGLLQPKAVRIIGSAALGALLAVGGLCWAIWSFRPAFDPTAGDTGWVLLGAWGAITLLGLIVQTRSEATDANAAAGAKKEKSPGDGGKAKTAN